MDKISGETIYNIIQYVNPQVEFTDEEKAKLIGHFRNNEMNQFYLIIINKIIAIKNFTVEKDELIPNLTRVLTDKIGKSSMPIKAEEEIILLAKSVYEVLFVIDIKEFYNKGF